MQIRLRHREAGVDAVEAQLAGGALEGERVGGRHGAAVVPDPFVHAPEMGVPQRLAKLVDEPGDER